MIRLYDKHELAFASAKNEYTEKMRSQYEFAKDNLQQMALTNPDYLDDG